MFSVSLQFTFLTTGNSFCTAMVDQVRPLPNVQCLITVYFLNYRKQFLYSYGRSSKTSPQCSVSHYSFCTATIDRVRPLPNVQCLITVYFLNYRKQFLYSCGRASSIWLVDESAKKCPDRERTAYLAVPKSTHQNFQLLRDVETIIPPAALKTKPSERLESLASPKQRPEGPFREPTWSVCIV